MGIIPVESPVLSAYPYKSLAVFVYHIDIFRTHHIVEIGSDGDLSIRGDVNDTLARRGYDHMTVTCLDDTLDVRGESAFAIGDADQ